MPLPFYRRLATAPSALRNWYRDLPRATRLSFSREITATLPIAVVTAVMGAGFCGFVARKGLGMSDGFLAILMASNMLGLMVTGPLIGFFHNTPKIVIIKRLILFASVLLCSILYLKADHLSPYLGSCFFVVLTALIQTAIALVASLRTTLWRTNYPDGDRAKLVVIYMLMVALVNSGSIFFFSYLMDRWNISFHWIYFISGLFGVCGALLFTRIRIRRESSVLRKINEEPNPPVRLFAGLAMLKRDKPFRLYMILQMFNGLSVLMVEVVLVIILADTFQADWIEGGAALTAIPLLFMGLAAPVWSRYFDRHNIFKVRFFSTLAWAISRLTLMTAVTLGSLPLVLISRVFSGIAMGGGQLAWRLGHMEFAPKDEDSLYMGAHISLTGIRGIVAPFLGIALYNLMGAVWLFALTSVSLILIALAFHLMPRFLPKAQRHAKDKATLALQHQRTP